MEGGQLSPATASGDLQQALAHGADAAAGGAAPQAARAAATSSGCATMEEEDGKSAAIAKAPVAATACIEDDLDDGSWEYQQQPGWEAPAPKVGAELLTELRLAELKRLIDRDARALRKQQEDGADRWDYPEEQQKEAQDCDGEARMEGAHLSTAMASGDLQQALAHGADG